jgi:SAM-dependent methyltransferase
VLEHIKDETGALREIRRVLRPDGVAVVQVPVDPALAITVEYEGPDPRDVGHVRRNGRDFARRLESAGFEVTAVRIGDGLAQADLRRLGLNDEPIYLLRPTVAASP